jgi:hypothetical protein
MPDTNSLPDNLDAVLRKYGKIWIWSILSAAVAALSVRYFAISGILTLPNLTGFAGNARNNPWSPLVLLWTFLPSLGTLVSVYFLLGFLRHHILPILFPEPPAAAAPARESESFTLTGASTGDHTVAPVTQEIPDGAQLLYRAFAAVVIGMALEAVEVLFSIIYRVVAG